MFKFGEGALGDEIKDTEISFSEVPMFNTDISPEEAMSFWNKQFESVPEISMKDILNRSEDEFYWFYSKFLIPKVLRFRDRHTIFRLYISIVFDLWSFCLIYFT